MGWLLQGRVLVDNACAAFYVTVQAKTGEGRVGLLLQGRVLVDNACAAFYVSFKRRPGLLLHNAGRSQRGTCARVCFEGNAGRSQRGTCADFYAPAKRKSENWVCFSTTRAVHRGELARGYALRATRAVHRGELARIFTPLLSEKAKIGFALRTTRAVHREELARIFTSLLSEKWVCVSHRGLREQKGGALR